MKRRAAAAALVLFVALALGGVWQMAIWKRNPVEARQVALKVHSLLPDAVRSLPVVRRLVVRIANLPFDSVYPNPRSAEQAARIKGEDVYRVLVLGDSVASASYLPAAERWTTLFSAELGRRLPDRRIVLVDMAFPGETTEQAVVRVNRGAVAVPADLVLIGYGLNDGYTLFAGDDGPRDPLVPAERFRRNLDTLIDAARTQTGAAVILLTAPPVGPRFAEGVQTAGQVREQQAAFRAYNDLVLEAARAAGASLADVERRFDEAGPVESLLHPDHLHPNTAAQRVICAAAVDAWDRAFASPTSDSR